MVLASGCVGDAADDGGATADRHCLVHVEPGSAADGAAKLGEMTCYDTIAEVMSAATGGTVVLPPTTEASVVDEPTLRAAGYAPEAATLGAIVIGTDYTGPNYTGTSLTITAPTGCLDRGTGASFTWLLNAMPTGWDNVVQSVLSSSDCGQTAVFDLPNQGGISLMTSTCRAPTLGALVNRTSSQKWIRGQQCF
jgi:hypothetical protein